MPALSGAHALCVCACMRAPFFHCAAHPGLSNNFLVATGATEALLRNDESVLENMHAYTLFKALRRPSCNVYMNVAQDVYKEQRRSIIRCILATDLAKHFEIVGQFKSHTTSVSAGEDVPDWTLSQMILMLKVRGPAAVQLWAGCVRADSAHGSVAPLRRWRTFRTRPSPGSPTASGRSGA